MREQGKKLMGKIAVLLCSFLMIFQAAGSAEEEQNGTVLPGGDTKYNLLLIGTDRRDESWNGNSDVMILATIDSEKERITMTSFMRDLYAEIPEHGVHKLNYAFAAGGADLLMDTLEDNYDLKIDNYMVVDFDEMASIVDSIGGVELTVTDAEVTVMNQYLDSMGAGESKLYAGGTYLMNGYQAVAYARNRYVGNCDYERTQRQRNVLHAIFDKMKNAGSGEMAALAAEILPEMEYDINILDMAVLTAALPDLVGYELVEDRIPYDDLHHSQDEMLVPDFPETIERLHEALD